MGIERRLTATDRVHEALRNAIARGEIGVGDRLVEEGIAERFGVSRTPVREALRRLSAEGFIDFTPHAGAVVNGWSREDAREIFEVRAELEAMGARLAAERARPAEIDRLARICDEMEAAARGDGVMRLSELNLALHHGILAASGHRRLEALAANLIEVGFLVRSYGTFSAEDIARSLSDHRQLIEAFRLGDARWAEATMRSHVLAAARIMSAAPEERAATLKVV
ncbi:GntR family transcriptional regulator [Acuticoccus kandeliae]|uniref:GntR family transcriptional regulator n=1 Tax=Acuticoccus kandeliae TaxID=2073160 RepID=UPI000D3E8858|nr:GntR family transcriptional regulator [Acuticoccus kandeliae]